MTIQFNTDKNIDGTIAFTEPFVAMIESGLRRFSDKITRVEAHLSDEDGHKDGFNTKKCVLEARLEHRRPIAVSSHSDTYDHAMEGALDKLITSITTIVDKRSRH